MVQTSWPYQTQSVEELEWRAMARLWRTSGVIENVDGELEVTEVTGALQVDVASGEAWLDGHYYASDATERLTLDDADLNDDRIDLIVVRSDAAANESRLAVITGTPATDPAAPTVTQDHEGAEVYEIALAEVLVQAAASNVDGQVTDRRTLIDRNVSKTELGEATAGSALTLSAAQTIPSGSLTVIDFDTIIYDDGFASAPNMVVPAAFDGKRIRVDARLRTNENANNLRRELRIKKNAVTVAWAAAAPGEFATALGTFVVDDAAADGDSYRVEYYQDSFADRDAQTDSVFTVQVLKD